MTCILDVGSSSALVDDRIVTFKDDDDIPNCVRMESVKGNDITISNHKKLSKDAIKDLVFRFRVARIGGSESRVVAQSWRDEVDVMPDSSAKKRSIMNKFHLFSIVDGKIEYDVGLSSVDDDIARLRVIVMDRIISLFARIDFDSQYMDAVERTQKLKDVIKGTPYEFYGGASEKETKETKETEFLGDFDAADVPSFNVPNSQNPQNNTENAQNSNSSNVNNNAQDSSNVMNSQNVSSQTPQEPPRENTKNREKKKKPMELPPLPLEIYVPKEVNVPSTVPGLDAITTVSYDDDNSTVKDTISWFLDSLGISSHIDDTDMDADDPERFYRLLEDRRIRMAVENMVRTSRVSSLITTFTEIDTRDLYAIMTFEMLKKSSSPVVWANALNSVLDFSRRHSKSPFVNRVEFWRSVSDVVSRRPGRSMSLFNSSAQAYRDALRSARVEIPNIDEFREQDSKECIDFTISILRRVELQCPPAIWPIAKRKMRASRQAIAELATDVVDELADAPIPASLLSEADVDSGIGKIVCQVWRKLLVPRRFNTKQSMIDRVMFAFVPQLENAPMEKSQESPFVDAPFIAEMADAFKLDIDSAYVTKGTSEIRRFMEREAEAATDCLLEVANEARRVRRDKSFNPLNTRNTRQVKTQEIEKTQPFEKTQPPKPQSGGGLEKDEMYEDMGERRAAVVGFFYERAGTIAMKYYGFHKRFWKRRLVKYVEYSARFRPSAQLSLKDGEVLRDFADAVADVSRRGEAFFLTLLSRVDDVEYDLGNVDEDSDAIIATKRAECVTRIQDLSENIVMLYKNEMGASLDAQFFVLAALKLVQLGITAFSLSMATKLFEDYYLIQVYTQSKPPPSLYLLIAYFLAFSVAINAVVFFVLWVLSYVKNLPSAPSLFDGHLLLSAFVDYFAVLVSIVVVMLIAASVIQKKKYFRYDLEGPRAIRALGDIVFYFAIALTFIPFFMAV